MTTHPDYCAPSYKVLVGAISFVIAFLIAILLTIAWSQRQRILRWANGPNKRAEVQAYELRGWPKTNEGREIRRL